MGLLGVGANYRTYTSLNPTENAISQVNAYADKSINCLEFKYFSKRNESNNKVFECLEELGLFKGVTNIRLSDDSLMMNRESGLVGVTIFKHHNIHRTLDKLLEKKLITATFHQLILHNFPKPYSGTCSLIEKNEYPNDSTKISQMMDVE